jgi:hypothetical protein
MDEVIKTIGEEPHFYGYLKGLSIERPDETLGTGVNFYASFIYGETVSFWKVPDAELFRILSGWLVSAAQELSHCDDYNGVVKLHIEKTDGKWIVDLP